MFQLRVDWSEPGSDVILLVCFSYVLIGQSQVMTSGVGEETYDVAEEGWIQVSPGDVLGLWTHTLPVKGGVKYSICRSVQEPFTILTERKKIKIALY